MHTKSPNYLSFEEFCERSDKAVLRTVHNGHICFDKRMFKVDRTINPETPALCEGEAVKVFLDPTGLSGGTLVVLGLDGFYRCNAEPSKMPKRHHFGGKVLWRFTRNAA